MGAEFWDIKYIGYMIYGRDITVKEHDKILKELKRFLSMKELNYKDFYKWIPGRGKQYFIPTPLAKQFINYYKKGINSEKEIVINEEYIKSGKSIQKELEEFKNELAKGILG